ncbi:hypothetical protein [Pectobacterium punjabense]|uniref:tail fiber/spike domain-containing protein n=1 Tax=Pectobacterium punjabense TaxID=2108399 RepID=UPI003D9AD8A7
MTTYKTGNPLGSAAAKDIYDNAENLDSAVNSSDEIWVDRLGIIRRTLVGIDRDANRAMLAYGYITKKSFELGNTLSHPNEVLLSEGDGEYYRWDGSLPKVVSAGSTPESTGGVGEGAWVGVGDATTRAYVNQIFRPADCFKIGNFGVGVELKTRRDAVLYNSLYYVYSGIFPHVNTESEPDNNYICVGLLNGFDIYDLRNWQEEFNYNNASDALDLLLEHYPKYIPGENSVRDKSPILIPPGIVRFTRPHENIPYETMTFLRLEGYGINNTIAILDFDDEYWLSGLGESVRVGNFRIEKVGSQKKTLLQQYPAAGRGECDGYFHDILSGLTFLHEAHGRGSSFERCTIYNNGSLSHVYSPTGFIEEAGSSVNTIKTAMRRFNAHNIEVDGASTLFTFDNDGELSQYINEVTINGVHGHSLLKLIDGGYLNAVDIVGINIVNSIPAYAITCRGIRSLSYNGNSKRAYGDQTPSGGTRSSGLLFVDNATSTATTDVLIDEVNLSGSFGGLGESLIFCRGYIGNININGMTLPNAYESATTSTATLISVNGVKPGGTVSIDGLSASCSSFAPTAFNLIRANLRGSLFVGSISLTGFPAYQGYESFTPVVKLANGVVVAISNAFGRKTRLHHNAVLVEFGFTITSGALATSRVVVTGHDLMALTSGSISSYSPSLARHGIQLGYSGVDLYVAPIADRFEMRKGDVDFNGSDIVAGMSVAFSFVLATA